MISACVQQGHKILKRGIKVNPKFGKRLSALLLSAVVAAGSVTSAGACTGMYIGSEESANDSTFVGRSEDIGKLYDKVFEVIPAADHADGDIYVGGDGFSMPYPSHTYRFTVMRDSVDAGDTMTDEDGNITAIAFGEAGMNEKGVAASATVSTANDLTLFEDSYKVWEWDSQQNKYVRVTKAGKGYDPMPEGGICEVSLNSVILMQAETARDGVEKLAAIIDKYGSGECNSITISDANEVWDFETLTGHQYVAVKMPKDKVSVNPNMVVMNEIDVSDTENVIASPELISMPLKNGILVSSQLDEAKANKETENITKIDIQKTYGAKDFGDGQYSRYWQGVNYLNQALAATVNIDRENGATPEGPFNMLFDADHKVDTYEALRLLAYRGEGSKYDSDTTGKYAIGNDNQGECHVFEIRGNMPDALSIVQWQTMSRAEFSVYLPYYSNLLTDTSKIFKSEYLEDADDIEEIIDNADFPADTSAYWVYAAINDLCDNNRDRYGANVKKFWENYQKQLIAQQADVDTAMKQIYAYSPALAEQKATELGKAVSEEAFGYAKSILTELRAFIAEHGNDNEVFVPTVLSENKLPTYSINMEGVNGTGIPSSNHHHSSNSSSGSTTSNTVSASTASNGKVSLDKSTAKKGDTVTITVTPDTGYELGKLTVTDAKGNTIDVTNLSNGKFSFVMPEGKVTVTPTFVADNGNQTESKSYSDVKTGDWFNDAVKYVSDKGLMSGTGSDKFAPSATTTRAMLMTVLARYAGEDTTGGATWYEKGMEWAKAKGVSDGTNPNANITREQLVTMMYRYAGSPKADGKLDSFSDAASVNSYAANAMQWAVANGIVNGSNGKLNPQNNATRAEVAAILMRFCEMSK